MGFSKSSSKRELYSNTILPQEKRKTSNRQPSYLKKKEKHQIDNLSLHLKQLEKEEEEQQQQQKNKASRRKEIIKIRA